MASNNGTLPVPDFLYKFFQYKYDLDFRKGDTWEVRNDDWFGKYFLLVVSRKELPFKKKNISWKYPNKIPFTYPLLDALDVIPPKLAPTHIQELVDHLSFRFDEHLMAFLEGCAFRDLITESYGKDIINAIYKDGILNVDQRQLFAKANKRHCTKITRKESILTFMSMVGIDDDDITLDALIKRHQRMVKSDQRKNLSLLRTAYYKHLYASDTLNETE